MSRKWKSRDNERTQRLSLAELAAHDDVCSDALVDNVSSNSLLVYSNANVRLGLLQISHTEEPDKTYSNPWHKGGRGPPDPAAESDCREGLGGSREGSPRPSRT